jgi:hypothetical protein
LRSKVVKIYGISNYCVFLVEHPEGIVPRARAKPPIAIPLVELQDALFVDSGRSVWFLKAGRPQIIFRNIPDAQSIIRLARAACIMRLAALAKAVKEAKAKEAAALSFQERLRIPSYLLFLQFPLMLLSFNSSDHWAVVVQRYLFERNQK